MAHRDLTGGKWEVVEVTGESLGYALAEAAGVVISTEQTHPRTGAVYNDRGAVRIFHNQDEEGHQLLLFFECT